MKGEITIELYDEMNVLKKRIKKKNYVKESYLLAKSEVMAYTGFDFTPMTQGVRRNHVESIMLTDYDGQEDPINERVIEGNIIARGNTTTTNNTGILGSYNASLSELRQDYHRRVWDFAINQGNGIMNSIYMVNSAALSQSLAPLFTITLPFSFQTMKLYKGKFYAVNGTALYVFENFNFKHMQVQNENDIADIDFIQYTLPINAHTFEIVDDKMYLTGAGTIMHIVGLDNPEMTLETKTLPQSVIRRLVYRSVNNTWIIGSSQTGMTVDTWICDNEFNVLKSFRLLPSGTNTNNTGMHLTANQNKLICLGREYDFETEVVGNFQHGTTNVGIYIEYNDEFTLVSNASSNLTDVVFCAPSTFLSRVLLDNQIKKEDHQAMRIIYEYHIPKFIIEPYRD